MNIFLKHIRYYTFGKQVKNNPIFKDGVLKSSQELEKKPTRTEVINFLISTLDKNIKYLEIGVRNPDHNFNSIQAETKYSVDPGLEYKENPVDFKLTSDVFFDQLRNGDVLSKGTKFDVIFIDGLHTSTQVDVDIANAFDFLETGGFIVLHDCNPVTEWHSREDYSYIHTPAEWCWSGTVWKSYLKWRNTPGVKSCCIDTDWGVGILSKTHSLGESSSHNNPFYEYSVLNDNRVKDLNLIDFQTLQKTLSVSK